MFPNNVLQILDDLELGLLQPPADVVLERVGLMAGGYGGHTGRGLRVRRRVGNIGPHDHARPAEAHRSLIQAVVNAVQLGVHLQQYIAHCGGVQLEDRFGLQTLRETPGGQLCGLLYRGVVRGNEVGNDNDDEVVGLLVGKVALHLLKLAVSARLKGDEGLLYRGDIHAHISGSSRQL